MEQPTSKTPDRKSALKTVTKKGITVNPKKEDLMKETMKAKLGASMDALKEAAKMNIPTLAFVNTETSLKNVDYPLFGQNRSIRWVYHAFNTFIQQKTIIS